MIASDPTIDYSKQGMNNRLQSKNSLANRGRFTTGQEFSANTEGNAISTYNVQTLNFGKLKGGTATLGGTTNGDGLLVINNAGGTEIVRADSTGITVNEGSIVIKNSSGSTTFDASGIVSVPNFITSQAGYYEGGYNYETSGTYVDMPLTTLSAFNISRPTNILIFLTIQVSVDNAANKLNAAIYIGGEVADIQEVTIETTDTAIKTYTTHTLRTLPSASPPTSYTIGCKWKIDGGTASVVNRQISYMLLGS